MEITEVRITLVDEKDSRVLAYCKACINDCLVVDDIKYIMGEKGPFVQMPNKKHSEPCWHCKHKNPLSACYCGNCGAPKPNNLAPKDSRHHHDVVFPITSECRAQFETVIGEAYKAAVKERQSYRETNGIHDKKPAILS